MKKTILYTPRGFTCVQRKISHRFCKISILAVLSFFGRCSSLYAQAVTEVITDYGSYWKSGSSSINGIKPDNTHNLLAFTFNGRRYSTGVNDTLLTVHHDNFIIGDYRALSFVSYSGSVNSNTKIGLGASYDGVPNGSSNPAPKNNIPFYLSDGLKGLDLGTCIANLPSGNIFFAVSNIDKSMIGDGVPDIIVTQVADPSGAADRYSFSDISGNRVGSEVVVNLSSIASVGNWTADFYEASNNPMTLSGGFTKTDRPLRMWAADFSDFGIDSAMISQIAYFKIALNGNSDVAFVAYNYKTINISAALLPVTITDFSGKYANAQAQLQWQSSAEINSDYFVVETSVDGLNFTDLANVKCEGKPSRYSFVHANVPSGINYYRLKQVDHNGSFNYSKIIKLQTPKQESRIAVYPNPAVNYISIKHGISSKSESLQLVNMQGAVVLQRTTLSNIPETTIDVQNLPAGIYQLRWEKDGQVHSEQVMIKR